jgi:56kDa selenium binding protein (SBP56)
MSVHDHDGDQHGGPGYASPEVARLQPPEQFIYVAALYEGTGIDRPDFFVDFHEQSEGARPHEIHLPGGDCTTEIFQ